MSGSATQGQFTHSIGFTTCHITTVALSDCQAEWQKLLETALLYKMEVIIKDPPKYRFKDDRPSLCSVVSHALLCQL